MVPPTQIGQYEILGIIGRGAMGVVYRAQDTKMFRRLVAIKVISENLIGDAAAIRRFHVEQETVAGLQHPNIVTIYDRGEFEDRQYFVMEYLEGSDLAQLIRERDSTPLDQRIEIAIQIAEALDFAHRREVIHRDIKPSNVMVIRRGDLNQAKLLDFGIVHVSRKGMTTTVTQPGTLLYMSPEQLRSMAVTTQSDLFSLGLVLFELFVGIHPFDAQSEPLVTAKILYQPPLVARDRAPDIPADLDALLAALLQKDTEKRPASAAVVATELRRVLRGLSDSPTTDPPRIALPGAETAARETLPAPPRQAASTPASLPSRFPRVGAGLAVAAVLTLSGWGGVRWWTSRGVERRIDALIVEARRLVDGAQAQTASSDPARLDGALQDSVSAGSALSEALALDPSNEAAKELQGRLRTIEGGLEKQKNALEREADDKKRTVAAPPQQAQPPGPATNPERTTQAIAAARNHVTAGRNALASDDPAELNRGLVACAIADSKLEEVSASDRRSGEVSALRTEIAGLKSSLSTKLESVSLGKSDRVGVKLDAWGAQADLQLDSAERLLGLGGRDNVLAGQEACAAATTSMESIRREKPDDERIARLQRRQEDLTRRLADALGRIDKSSDDLSDLFDRWNRTSSLAVPANDSELKARLEELHQIGDGLESRSGAPRAAELRRKLDGASRQMNALEAFFAYLGAYKALDFKRLQDIFPRAPFEIKGSFEDLRTWDATIKNVVLDLGGDTGTLRCRLHESILTRTSGPQTLDVDLTLVLQPGSEGWIVREHRIVPVSAR
jgi:tRNA A-37 threonylcarbamoyl transferase component Bud32